MSKGRAVSVGRSCVQIDKSARSNTGETLLTGFGVLKGTVAILAVAPLIAACGTKDLSRSCLPLQAPATVRLAAAVAYQPAVDTDLLLAPMRPTRIDPVLPAGTTLRIDRISQPVVFDSSFQDIEVFGRLPDGRTFLYRWGSGQDLYRAPWEPLDTPQLRKMRCADT
jgi:hypothetical protein